MVLLLPHKSTMVVNTFLIILIKIIQKYAKSIDMRLGLNEQNDRPSPIITRQLNEEGGI